MSAAESSSEDRQLPASERRIRQAREEGRLPRSRDLAHLATVLALLALVAWAGPWLAHHALELVAGGLRFDRAAAFTTAVPVNRLASAGADAVLMTGPVILVIGILLTGASLAVGGWNFTSQAFEARLDRLDPLAGFARIFGLRHALEHLKVVFVAAAVLGVAAWYLFTRGPELALLARMPVAGAISHGLGWLESGLFAIAGVCAAAALADVPLQLWRHHADLRMTREEARQEHKESEGDPHVKGERRRRARELARGRMLADVPQASVVITNPTHYAVALRYDEGSSGAPRIVAMGVDHLALKIREIAAGARVPVLEAPPLARALYRHGEVGKEVPVELYLAVAQVLAWVFRLRTALRPPAPPVIDVPAGFDPQEAA